MKAKTEGVEDWIDKRINLESDEHLILKIYRFCKKHHQFLMGLALGIIITVVVLK